MVCVIYNDFDRSYYSESLSTCKSLISDVNDYFAFEGHRNSDIPGPVSDRDKQDLAIKRKVNNFLKKFSPHTHLDLLAKEASSEELRKARAFLKVIEAECRKRSVGTAYIGVIG